MTTGDFSAAQAASRNHSHSRRHTIGDNSSSPSQHSGVFAEDVDDTDYYGQGNRMNDQKILENARFGLATVKLRSGKSTSRRAPATTGRTAEIHARTRQRLSTLANTWVGRVKVFSWRLAMVQLATTMRLVDSIYILISVPLRVGFFFDPWDEAPRRTSWNSALSVFTTLDLIGVLLRAWFAREELRAPFHRALRYLLRGCLRRVDPSDKPRLRSVLRASSIFDGDLQSLRSHVSGLTNRGDFVSAADALPDRVQSRASQRMTVSISILLSTAFSCFPLEVVAIAVLRNYNLLHLVSLTRYLQAFQIAPRIFSEVVLTRYRHLYFIQALSFSSIAAIAVLFVIGVYLVHIAGSGYMLLAHAECGLRFDKCANSVELAGTWVQRDRLEHGSLWRKYIRSMYWGSKTVTTLGQGDVIPATQAETAYRVLVQFISGLWATAILTAYSFYFSRKDAKMASNLTTRLEQTTKFLASRRVPPVLVTRVQTFFEYMQRTRIGVEEEMALEGLPSHYRVQNLNYIKYRSFRRLPLFKNKDGAFLRSIFRSLEKDYFAPRQIVVNIGDPEEMFVVAKGEISILDASDTVVGRLTPENAYAESGLFCALRTAPFKLIADTHCEVWILHQDTFRTALVQHFTKPRSASLTPSHDTWTDRGSNRVNPMPFDMVAVAQKFKIHEFKATNKLTRKLPSRASLTNKKKLYSWRQPNSTFQRTWKHIKCALLIFQLYEVPYQIAYERGFGLVNPADFPLVGAVPRGIQEANFYVALLIEMFFYADWYFRAQFFYRFVVGNDAGDAADSSASFGMLTTPSTIFRHYRETENTTLDVIQHLPFPLVWDFLPKNGLSSDVIYVARFIRLLRLVRLHRLRTLLRSLMIDHALSPSKRQLVYVVIFCTSSAHVAACLFFLIGDKTSFRGGLPIKGVFPGSTTAADCLQGATLFQNCTWYVYDRSMFSIDAPYLRALQWSVVLLSTVGFGEIVSFSTSECVLGCVWIFLGANICYCIGCILSSILGQLQIHATIRDERMEEVNLALQSAQDITEHTKVMIRSYYDTKWELNGCAKRDHEILGNLPRSLRYGVSEALYLEDLRSCYLFVDGAQGRPSVLLRELARLARSEIFLKNVMVVREGHLATEFFVIQRGEVELLLAPLVAPCPCPLGGSGERPRQEHTQRPTKQPSTVGKVAWVASRDISNSAAFHPHASTTRVPADTAMALSRQSARDSMIASALYSRGTKLSSADLRLPLWRRQPVQEFPSMAELIPISILQRTDCFGEESIMPKRASRTYQVNVRVVASAHLTVISRTDLVVLSTRFPDEFQRIFELIRAKAERDNVLFRSLRMNFMFKAKIAQRLGIPKSLYVGTANSSTSTDTARSWFQTFCVVDPENACARWWYRIVSTILVYNFYVVIFRVAFLPRPSDATMVWLTMIDYLFDLLLYIDIVLKYGWLGYIERGEKIMNRSSIRKRYVSSWLPQDCWSMLPTFYIGNYFIMTLCRLPRLLRSPQLLLILDNVHAQIVEHFLRGNKTKLSSVFDLFRFVLIFVSTAHYVGSVYYLLGRVQLEWGIADSSWINVDFILLQYPDNVWVHYMRTMYWCLSTFTVDCFGDILARNFLETLYSMSTCILGWIFIGQVIGRINVLMITLDKEAQQHQTRIEDFDQYAQQRKLPPSLRRRALQSLSFKSACSIPLRLGDIFHDLPRPLRFHFFNELYTPLLRSRLEFEELTATQLEAVASALQVEIYLPGDVIYECGRAGTTLFLMQQGLAELYSPRASIVFAAIETGALFGECAFFIPGAKRLASARAVRSCQVLQLHRHQWSRLWPESVRVDLERKVLKVVVETYRTTARVYLHMTKYFYIKNENTKPPRSLTQRIIFQQRQPLPPMQPFPADATHTKSAPVNQHRRPSLTHTLVGRASISRPVSPLTYPAVRSSTVDSLHYDGGRTSSPGSSIKLSKGGNQRQLVTPSPSSLGHQLSTSTGFGTQETSRRPSTASAVVELPQRRSTLTALAEALGLHDQLQSRPTSGTSSLPPLLNSKSNRKLYRHDTRKNGLVLPTLSAATQLKWKSAEKRLAAIRMFRVSVARVERDLETALERSSSLPRRASISVYVAPAVAAALDEQRAQLHSQTILRRHSIHVDKQSLLKELLAFDGFENEDDGCARETINCRDAWDNDHDDSADEVRAVSNSDTYGSFTLSSFLLELTIGSKQPFRTNRSDKVTPRHNKPSYELVVRPSPGPEMFQEYSRFRQTWDTIMLCVTIYYALVVPFRACFVHDHMDDPRFGVTVTMTFALEYVFTDLPCVLDFVLRRHHFEYTEVGEIVSEPERIASHYWHDGTYLMDVLALAPIEVIAVGVCCLLDQSYFISIGLYTPDGALPVWRTLAFARANRALRPLVHLHSLSDRVQRFVLYDLKVAWLRPSVCYVLRLGLDFALGTHWISCLFFGASYFLYEADRPSWLTTPGMLVFDASCTRLEDVSRVPVVTKYLRSFHFSIGAVTTVCYGDILPMNAQETVVTIIVIFLSVGLFSMLSGGFFKFFEMELGKRADYEEKVSQVGRLMVFHQVPSRMWKQMQVFFALSWQESKGMHEEEMLRGVTRAMRDEIACHVHANLLQHVKLFRTCEPPFVRALLTVLQHELYVRNAVIIQRGDRSRSLYIIESGLVSIRRPEKLKRTPTSASIRVAMTATHASSQPFQDPGHTTSVSRLRNSKLIIGDLKSAALAAPSTPPETSAVLRPNLQIVATNMVSMLHHPEPLDSHGTGTQSRMLKLQVRPKHVTRTPSGILAPDSSKSAVPPPSLSPTARRSDRGVRSVKGSFDYFGEQSLLFGTPRTATCVALCVCSVYVLTLEQYERLLEQFPAARRKNSMEWGLTDRTSFAADHGRSVATER